jgi:hypothetical protein
MISFHFNTESLEKTIVTQPTIIPTPTPTIPLSTPIPTISPTPTPTSSPSPTLIPPTPAPLSTIPPAPTLLTINPRSQEYLYFNNRLSKISLKTYGNIAYNLSQDKHIFYYYNYEIDGYNNSIKKLYLSLLENSTQDIYMKDILNSLQSISPDKKIQARVIISIVQYIPYRMNKPDDYYYPYETLYNNFGDCDDKSVLLAYLLEYIGYDVVLFDFFEDEHMAVGIKSDPAYDFHDTGYAFIESTQRSIITDSYKYNNSPFTIIPYGTSTDSLNVSSEYNDAILLHDYFNNIDTNNTNMNSSEEINSINIIIQNYNNILEKYGITSIEN